MSLLVYMRERIWGVRKVYPANKEKGASLLVGIPISLVRSADIEEGDRFRFITKEEFDEIFLEPINEEEE